MFFNYMLLGSLAVQVYHYYASFPRDSKRTKAIVYILFILELSQTTIMSYFAYTIFGSGYGNLEVFDKSALEWFPVCILGSLVAGIVQGFYAHRLYVFSGSKIAGGIVALLALLQVGSGIGQGIISKLVTDRSNLTAKPTCVLIWLLSSAVCDLMIAGSMTFYLKRQRILSSHTKDAITRIVRYTVETGSITALVAIVQVIVQLAFPKNNFFETPSWTLGKLYSNNLLASRFVLLNARAVVVGGRNYSTFSDGCHAYVNEIHLDSRGDIRGAPLDANRTHVGTNKLSERQDTEASHVQISKEVKRYGSQGTLEMPGV
ncbi:hypothetical protein MVEN_02354700 [Mycena venus]|uniref:DUF6534 domain-containing protein n=1 Tax=Mycena venus TaxID=2733690 RepID=A0A8H6X2V1_9AGAR|nr:hypothetical protein MVEN_02354700 [Mycena venus]